MVNLGYVFHVLSDAASKPTVIALFLALAMVLSGGVLLGVSAIRREAEQPAWRLFSYGDSPSGDSKVVSAVPTPGGWRIVCRLGAKPMSYCGLGLEVPPYDSSTLDMSDLADIEALVRNTAGGAAKVLLNSHDPAITRPDVPLSYRYSEARMEPTRGRIHVSARDFKLATWWLDLGRVSPRDKELRLDRFHGFGVQIHSPRGRELDTLEVLDLRFHTRLKPAWGVILPLWIGAAVLASWWGLSWRRWRRARGQERELPVPEPLALKSASDEARERLVGWLRVHYKDSELDAEAVAKATGIPKDRLGSMLREAYGMPFKPFLNELRLAEATRLLQETDRTVSEIAFAVGYNTHTHFSRIFRDRYACTPVEWREKSLKGGVESHPPT